MAIIMARCATCREVPSPASITVHHRIHHVGYHPPPVDDILSNSFLPKRKLQGDAFSPKISAIWQDLVLINNAIARNGCTAI